MNKTSLNILVKGVYGLSTLIVCTMELPLMDGEHTMGSAETNNLTKTNFRGGPRFRAYPNCNV